MKNLKEFVFEKLRISSKTKSQVADPEDPTTWNVDDILWTAFSYNARIPMFWKIKRKTGRGFTVVELEKEIVDGAYNSISGYKVMPKEDKETDETYNVRINKFGNVKINGNHAYLWDGEPQEGWSD